MDVIRHVWGFTRVEIAPWWYRGGGAATVRVRKKCADLSRVKGRGM